MDTYSQVKVCSAIIRQVKNAFEQVGNSMPDEAREVVFPAGVPVQMLEQESPPSSRAQAALIARQ